MMVAVPERGFRRVMHCDLDCFFAAVEELDDATLVGKPVIVGGDPDRRGVVSTANYVARRYGVHSAMSAAIARRLCPTGVFLRPRMERYRELSQQVMAILDEYFLVRERVSIDEAYGELAPSLPGCQPAELIARALKARVKQQTGLTISIGAGRTKSIAKLASDLSKPDGCLVVKPSMEEAFLRPLRVGQLHGVGPRTRERLEQLGLHTVGQIADYKVEELQRAFGKQGRWLWELANGHDDRPVLAEHGPPKSISRETTYEHDIADLETASAHVRSLAADVARRADRQGLAGRTVTLKIKWADFRVMTRQGPLDAPSRDPDTIGAAALSLLRDDVAPLLGEGGAIRLLGVGLSGFTDAEAQQLPHGYVQLPLFAHVPIS